ncbi:neutral/alkaline non-lysosomal ceramidase N-terminal domain-containing protein, partial [bacterium]|nr:neutral/alkaline non-lysosomal ceramidase N-terminal domain-containing protein [bacterium]
ACFKAGLAKVDITPTEPVWLHGWGSRTKPMQGVSLPIHAKALALRDGSGHTAVLVTADLLGFSRAMTLTIAQRARRRYGLDRSQLILNASHNHSGPLTTGVLPLYFELSKHFSDLRDQYTERLLDQVVEIIGAAIDELAPVRLSFGQGLAGVGVNRRRARAGGRSLPAVVDQDVPVLSVKSSEGELRAIVFGYSCHATCIEDGKINGDWPGYAQAAVEEAHPGVIALFVQGCGGDINPLPRFRPGLGERYGSTIAAAVEQVLEDQARDQHLSGQVQGGKPQLLSGPLRCAFGEVEIPFLKLPTRKELLSLRAPNSGTRRCDVEYQLSLLKSGDRRPRALLYPIHLWQFGNGLKLIALSSEPVADYSLRFKQVYGWENTWVSGYNDDYWCYIPSRRVWEEGGYEGRTGMLECSLPGPFSPAVEKIIAAKVDELVRETSAQLQPFPRPRKHQ